MDVRQALGDVSADTIRLCELRARLDRWAASGEQLSQWVAYRDRAEHATALGCGDVVERLADGRQMPESVIPAFEITYYEAIYADMVRAEPELGVFDGTLHGRLARDFAAKIGRASCRESGCSYV